MSTYYRTSGLTWSQYLQTQSFVDDIKDGIRRTGKAMSSKIDEQTDDIVVSNEALGESISAGLDQLDSALQSLIRRLLSMTKYLRSQKYLHFSVVNTPRKVWNHSSCLRK